MELPGVSDRVWTTEEMLDKFGFCPKNVALQLKVSQAKDRYALS